MAKGSKKGDSANGTPTSLTELLSPPVMPVTLTVPQLVSDHISMMPMTSSISRLQALAFEEDRRRHYPDQSVRPPGHLIRSAIRLYHSPERALGVPNMPSFRIPNLVTICVRRKMRREVLHALNKTKGGRGGRRRRNQWSGIKC